MNLPLEKENFQIAKRMKVILKKKKNNEFDNTFVWTWTDEAIYFCSPILTPLGFTPLLPEATVKIDFDLQVCESFKGVLKKY